MAISEPRVEAKVKEVPSQAKDLDASTDKLLELISRLESDLASVLSGAPQPQVPTAEKSLFNCDLARDLSSSCRRVYDMMSQVDSIIDRLEL